MADNRVRPHVVVGGYGSPPIHLSFEMVQAFRRMKILPILLKVVAKDFNVSTSYRGLLPKAVPRGKFFQPKVSKTDEREFTYGMRGRQNIAMRRRNIWGRVISQGNDAIIQAARRAKIRDPLTVWFSGWAGGHVTVNIQALRERSKHFDDELKLLVLVLPHQPSRRNVIRDRADLPYVLQRDELVACTLLLDNLSALVARYPEEATEESANAEERGRGMAAMDQRAGIGLASAIAGPWHFPTGMSPADIIQTLADASPMSGMSFGSRHLPTPDEPPLTRLARQFVGQAPPWYPEDLYDAAHIAAQEALDIKPGNSTVDAEPKRGAEKYLIFTVPLPRTDARWIDLRADIANWLQHPDQRLKYGDVVPIWTSGEGTAEFGQEDAGYKSVQATCWWPLQQEKIAEPVQAILDSPDTRRDRRRGETEEEEDES